MRAAESCLRAVLSVSPGLSATWEKRLEARRNAPPSCPRTWGTRVWAWGLPAPRARPSKFPRAVV